MQAKRSLRFCQGNTENAITFILEQRKAREEQKERCAPSQPSTFADRNVDAFSSTRLSHSGHVDGYMETHLYALKKRSIGSREGRRPPWHLCPSTLQLVACHNKIGLPAAVNLCCLCAGRGRRSGCAGSGGGTAEAAVGSMSIWTPWRLSASWGIAGL